MRDGGEKARRYLFRESLSARSTDPAPLDGMHLDHRPVPAAARVPIRTRPAWECPSCSASNTAASPRTRPPLVQPRHCPSGTLQSKARIPAPRAVMDARPRPARGLHNNPTYFPIMLVAPFLSLFPRGFGPYATQSLITRAASISSGWLPCGALSNNVLTGLRPASNTTSTLADPFGLSYEYAIAFSPRLNVPA